MKKLLIAISIFLIPGAALSHKAIDRKALFTRNNPIVTKADPLSSLTVGNGRFATTVDFTGLQSYPEFYSNGVPLCAMSDWGWHSFPNTENFAHSETYRELNLGHGHGELYAVEHRVGTRESAATTYFRVNPHRLNLAHVGLSLTDAAGNAIKPTEIEDIRQELSLWDGFIESSFKADEKNVNVTTSCMQTKDCLLASVRTELLRNRQASISIRLPYPTGKHSDDASDYNKADAHSSEIIFRKSNGATIRHTLDDTVYYLNISWEGDAMLEKESSHHFNITTRQKTLNFAVEYLLESPETESSFSFKKSISKVKESWHKYWNNGAVVDFSLCTDPRAKELERRVVLSQYLTAVNCASPCPPQETGLTYNSWFGRPHLEMTWWHAVDFALWNHPEVLEQMMEWYNDIAFDKSRELARRQGFKGVRWLKMTDPEGGEAPSNVGSFLIWQQPHYIYMAEELYRAKPSTETLRRYSKQVEATAEFMADYAESCAKGNKQEPIKLFGHTSMQEWLSKDFSYNHPFELAYWRYGLEKAQQWRERQGLERNKTWDEIINRLSPLPQNNGIYTGGEPFGEYDTGFRKSSLSDHPAVLGACGILPDMGLYDSGIMKRTLADVMENWNWGTTWGWDYGMIAMCAARLGEPETAIDALMIDKGKNTYLINGHNYQEPNNLRIYLPGNGSLLDAIAMMCAGWDNCKSSHNPGFPSNGAWNVRWEGLKRMQ